MDRRRRLEALRDSLRAVLDEGVGARDMAALSREYRATMAELATLEALDAESVGDPVDEIAARRAARGAVAAPVSRRPATNPG